MKKIIVVFVLLWQAGMATAEEYNAKVIAVMDGDTLLVLHAGSKVKIRLADIDAPEKAQVFGMQSKQAMTGMVLNKPVRIVTKAVDKYGRTVALVFLERRNINQEMVRRGMAWAYSYSHRSHDFVALQNEAQQARRGLWRERNPMPPWQWRKTHSPTPGGNTPQHNAALPHARSDVFLEADCGSKTHCGQMSSCDEAFYYYIRCAVKTLDKEGDGMPCKQLCERH